jgi:hypothetical protein
MSEDEKIAKAPPSWTDRREPGSPSGETALIRFLGGTPGTVFLRLLFVSLVAGAFLMWLDIRPWDVYRAIKDLADRIWAMGFGAIREITDYILAGAAIVVPVWLVLRLLNMRGAR